MSGCLRDPAGQRAATAVKMGARAAAVATKTEAAQVAAGRRGDCRSRRSPIRWGSRRWRTQHPDRHLRTASTRNLSAQDDAGPRQ